MLTLYKILATNRMNPNTCIQNKLTQFTLKGISNILQTSKRENKACCTTLQATCRKH